MSQSTLLRTGKIVVTTDRATEDIVSNTFGGPTSGDSIRNYAVLECAKSIFDTLGQNAKMKLLK